MFDTTEITPLPPTASIGRVNESSPETTVTRSPQRWTISLDWSKLPDASFTATMFWQSFAIRSIVAGRILTTLRGGML